jgi:hypothetical protein
MIDETTRVLQIVFVSDQKQFIQVLQKKRKSDYLLNVNKIIRDKFGHEIVVPNKIQAFLINYEIKKIIDKAVNVRNRKYERIVYINSNLTPNTILNTIDFLTSTYGEVHFEPLLIDLEEDISPHINIKTIKKGL